MERVALIHMYQQRLQAGKVRGQLTLDQLHDRQIGRHRIAGVHQRQREHFAAWEAARRISGRSPNDIDCTLLYLIDQFRRSATQGHCRVDLDP